MSFTATARTNGTVLFNWSPPPFAQQNGVLTHYTLTCAPPLFFNYGPNEVGGTGEGFSPATRYTCTLTASTAIGAGPSASVTIVTCKYIIIPRSYNIMTVAPPTSYSSVSTSCECHLSIKYSAGGQLDHTP